MKLITTAAIFLALGTTLATPLHPLVESLVNGEDDKDTPFDAKRHLPRALFDGKGFLGTGILSSGGREKGKGKGKSTKNEGLLGTGIGKVGSLLSVGDHGLLGTGIGGKHGLLGTDILKGSGRDDSDEHVEPDVPDINTPGVIGWGNFPKIPGGNGRGISLPNESGVRQALVDIKSQLALIETEILDLGNGTSGSDKLKPVKDELKDVLKRIALALKKDGTANA